MPLERGRHRQLQPIRRESPAPLCSAAAEQARAQAEVARDRAEAADRAKMQRAGPPACWTGRPGPDPLPQHNRGQRKPPALGGALGEGHAGRDFALWPGG